jgi:hypothetical protein
MLLWLVVWAAFAAAMALLVGTTTVTRFGMQLIRKHLLTKYQRLAQDHVRAPLAQRRYVCPQVTHRLTDGAAFRGRMHVVTYADDMFAAAAARQAAAVQTYIDAGVIASFRVISPEELHALDAAFPASRWVPACMRAYRKRLCGTLLSRGGGYYLWKPIVVAGMLRDLPPGDVLVYLDAGFVWQPHTAARAERLFAMARHTCAEGLLVTLSGAPDEPHFTRPDVCQAYAGDATTDYRLIAPRAGMLWVCRGNTCAEDLISAWRTAAIHRPHEFLDAWLLPRPLQAQMACRRPGLWQPYHRHDQSILMLLLHFYRGETDHAAAWAARRPWPLLSGDFLLSQGDADAPYYMPQSHSRKPFRYYVKYAWRSVQVFLASLLI